MDNQDEFKQPYLPPKVTAVSFKVELGAGASGLLDINLSDDGGMSTYSSASNDGESFWDDNMSNPVSSESYTGGTWSW